MRTIFTKEHYLKEKKCIFVEVDAEKILMTNDRIFVVVVVELASKGKWKSHSPP